MKLFMQRIADALERMAPPKKVSAFDKGDVFTFNENGKVFEPVTSFNYVPFEYLIGIDRQKSIMLENTERFLEGKRANNALLWGARGCGKSSLIKAVFQKANEGAKAKACLLGIRKNDLKYLDEVIKMLEGHSRKFIIYCDDLCFDENDKDVFRYLKTLLDGGLNAMPDNVILYATSNRRHLIKEGRRDDDAIGAKEDTDEGVALSDRFGLWIGFHEINQDEYLQIVDGYVKMFGLDVKKEEYVPKALEWSVTRGARSGRVAYQFAKSL